MIPLASDTATLPTPAMRRAMAEAEVGDEQFGQDPTVLRLLERVCALTGKEAGLWMPSGVMCNLVAIKAHTKPGDAVLAEGSCHVTRSEAGGTAVLSGVMLETVSSDHGLFGPREFEAALARVRSVPEPYGVPAKLLCVEQTHNFGGGTVWPLPRLREVCDAARAEGVAVHMDGARLFNASVASGTPVADFAACVDSLWVDFTKGLGAPIGAVLVGSLPFVREARRWKHAVGGAQRQAGIAAAGCLHALDRHVERLAEDHANAASLSEGLAAIPGLRLMHERPPTNIVFFDVAGAGLSAEDFVAGMKERGVIVGALLGQVRAVTHLGVSSEDVAKAVEAARAVAAGVG